MRKKKISERLGVKIFAYFVTVLSFCSALICLIGIYLLADWGFYEKSQAELKQEILFDLVQTKGMEILEYLDEGREKVALSYCENSNLSFWVTDQYGNDIAGCYETAGKYKHYVIEVDDKSWSSLVMHTADETKQEYIYTGANIPFLSKGDEMHLYVRDVMYYDDDFRMVSDTISWGYGLKNYLPPIGIALLVLSIASFIFQMCCAGKKYEQETVTAGGLAGFHLDLLTLIMIIIAALGCILVEEGYYYINDLIYYILVGLAAAAGVVLAVGYFLIWAIQVKAGIWWTNTVICKVLRLIGSILRFILRVCRTFLRLCISKLPQMVLVSLGLLVWVVVEGVLMIAWGMDAGDIFAIWLLDKVILVPLVLYLAIVLFKLQEGSEALAEGDLSYQVNTGYMIGSFKDHGENLNSIAEGMNVAVEERLKSERLKTELITNVSHDIKTPLTSIINYAELIAEEPVENEKITEYSQVLKRQSARLKKLIEDLMEASKASTGNIEVHMVPCEVGVLLTQTMGEYEQRLSELGLELIARQPEHPVRIMADGKLLWRVFDNLLNNICKYAMKGTRVYLSVEEKGEKVAIAFKNISKYPLDITAEELMERFVRGDKSRHTEGNGLGLSIAQSLTQLQNGVLELTADGDFFKVVLVFDALKADVEKE